MKRRFRTVLVWALLVGLVLIILMSRGGNQRSATYVTLQRALLAIEGRQVVAYCMRADGLRLITEYGDELAVDPSANGRVLEQLEKEQIRYQPAAPENGWSSLLVWIVVPVLVVLAILYFWKKMNISQTNAFMDLRKSKSRPVEERDKAKFSDIGGQSAAVALLADIVDFLKSPQAWRASGARLPRGILLVGPPGTGKTLVARAVAGETNSTFFYTSAAEFIEMFVGVGAARVRDTFEKAAAQQPAVIFIDELDAIGRRRGSGLGTMHEEREQTLNQLLVLMDGLERHEQLVVMAATNRPDVLDPALLRSGRFDRLLRLTPPTLQERVEILKIHTRDKPLDTTVSLEQLAQQTEGFVGADLEALTNDAALLAVRRGRASKTADRRITPLTTQEFEEALQAMTSSNRQFDRLDCIVVESVSQFAEPTGRIVARVSLTSGNIVEGEVLWMNASHIKLRTTDGTEVIVAKDGAQCIVPLAGTELASQADFAPDRWANKSLDVG